MEYLLIVDFEQKTLLEEVYNKNTVFPAKEKLILTAHENCKNESARFSNNLENDKKILFIIRDKFGNFYIGISNNDQGKKGFIFDLLIQIEEICNMNDLEVSREFSDSKKKIQALILNFNKKYKIEVISDISKIEKEEKHVHPLLLNDLDISEIEKDEYRKSTNRNIIIFIMATVVFIIIFFIWYQRLYKK